MPFITEPAREVPVLTDADVVVCGGGPAGIMAATAAARGGARVLLLERHGFLGGLATAGLVGPLSKFNFDGQRIVGGLPEEFIRNLHALGGAVIDLPSGNVPFDAELYKLAAQRLVRSAGVELLHHTQVAGAIWPAERPGALTHVVVETKAGRVAIAARFVIDCTGTGELVARTTLPVALRNREPGSELQPMTLCFRLGGVDTEQLRVLMAQDRTRYANQELRTVLQAEVAAGRLRNFGGPWVVHGSTIRAGEVFVNATRCGGDPTDPRQITQAEILLREEVHAIAAAFRRAHPAFAHSHLLDTAPQIGIRESRGIAGVYTMTVEDLLTPRAFPDTVAKGGHPIDVHAPGSPAQHAPFLERAYDIPFRCLIPIDSENVLVAGACLAASREAFGSLRVQAQCMALGQAAGTAAALCVARSLPVAELDGAALRAQLAAAGAIV